MWTHLCGADAPRGTATPLSDTTWGALALRCQIACAGHVARLCDARLAKVAQWDNSLPVWRTRQFLIGNAGGLGHLLRDR